MDITVWICLAVAIAAGAFGTQTKCGRRRAPSTGAAERVDDHQ